MIQTLSGRKFPAVVIPLIEVAKNSIDIVVYDWRWYPSDPGAVCQLFNQSIIRAVRRGVKVRAIVNNSQILSVLLSQGIEVKKLLTTKLVHAKLMIIDNQTIITGSHNYTQSAFQMNLELSVLFQNIDIVADFNVFFNNLWGLK